MLMVQKALQARWGVHCGGHLRGGKGRLPRSFLSSNSALPSPLPSVHRDDRQLPKHTVCLLPWLLLALFLFSLHAPDLLSPRTNLPKCRSGVFSRKPPLTTSPFPLGVLGAASTLLPLLPSALIILICHYLFLSFLPCATPLPHQP